jgi:hypothetical protein
MHHIIPDLSCCPSLDLAHASNLLRRRRAIMISVAFKYPHISSHISCHNAFSLVCDSSRCPIAISLQ